MERTAGQRLLDLIFPPKCVFCGRLAADGLCAACESVLPWTGAQASRTGADFGVCAAPLWYEGAVRDSLLRYKFSGRACYAETYGRLLAGCAAAELSGRFDTVTWVPVSRKRMRQRGYDQAELLARAMCRLWAEEPVRLLQKTLDNPAQSGLSSAEARRANVLGVYEAVSPAALAGKRVLLVDDILTTGSTLGECARVLRLAGAAEVVCAALAAGREARASTEK